MSMSRSDDIILINGKRRSGKSHYLKRYIQRLMSKHIRLVLWDYNHEYDEIPRSGVIVYYPADIIREYNKGKPFIFYRPLQKRERDFDLFCEICESFNNIVVIIEEVERYANSYRIAPYLKRIIDTGRHKGIGLICTSRRTMRLHPDIPFNANHIIIFRQTRPQDLKYLSEFVGEGVFAIKDMPQYSYFHYDDRLGTLEPHAPI